MCECECDTPPLQHILQQTPYLIAANTHPSLFINHPYSISKICKSWHNVHQYTTRTHILTQTHLRSFLRTITKGTFLHPESWPIRAPNSMLKAPLGKSHAPSSTLQYSHDRHLFFPFNARNPAFERASVRGSGQRQTMWGWTQPIVLKTHFGNVWQCYLLSVFWRSKRKALVGSFPWTRPTEEKQRPGTHIRTCERSGWKLQSTDQKSALKS